MRDAWPQRWRELRAAEVVAGEAAQKLGGEAVPPATARNDQGPPPFDHVINILDLAQMASVYQQRVATCP